MVGALIVRKALGREFQREIAEYMGERGNRLVFGFGKRVRLLVLGRREIVLSGFVGHQVWKNVCSEEVVGSELSQMPACRERLSGEKRG